ncbi:MAG: FAD-binding oxidoreductase, partial [Methyloversatilis sp.]|nr:FAD-binding oxidoreductase [Methyloversatilis sp.]
VARKVRESDEITSFLLAPVDGRPVLRHAPGEYIGLRVNIDGQEMRRNYSLSATANGRDYRISVKREAGGRVSGHLHEAVSEGDVLDLFPPAGDFTLRASDRPVALITAGVGITPALPMMEAALDQGREVHFIHCARHGGVHAFRDHVEALAQRHPRLKRFYVYSEPRDGDKAHAEGFIERLHLERWLPQPSALEAYFLGPKPFMARVKKQLSELGVPAAHTHYEFFGPAAALDG